MWSGDGAGLLSVPGRPTEVQVEFSARYRLKYCLKSVEPKTTNQPTTLVSYRTNGPVALVGGRVL